MKKNIDDFLKYHLNIVLRKFFAKEPITITDSKRDLGRQTVIDILYDARFSAKLYAFYGIREKLTDEVSKFLRQVESYFTLPYDEGISKIHPQKERFLNQWLMTCINHGFEEKKAKQFSFENNGYLGTIGYGYSGDLYFKLMKGLMPGSSSIIDNMKDLLDCRGCGSNDPFFHKASATFLKNIPGSLVRLAKMLGRCENSVSKTRPHSSHFLTASKTDICGVSMGKDLSCVIPSEIALLSDPSTENLFYKKMQSNSLQLFLSRSEQKVKVAEEGAIMIGIDTSGSMSGLREVMAKTLALAIILIAQKKKRPVDLYNFSVNAEKLVITDFIKQKKEIRDFITSSQGGGTDVYDALRQMTANYDENNVLFKNADILLVSDFEIPPLTDEMKAKCKSAIDNGARFYALNVGRAMPNDYFDLCYKRFKNKGYEVVEA